MVKQDHCKKPCTINLQKRLRSVKINKKDKILSKRQLPGLTKQRENTVVTIFRLASTSLHQVYYEDHEITEIYMQHYNGRK